MGHPGRDRRHDGWSAEARRLLPDVGIQVPPNLSDWWPGSSPPARPTSAGCPRTATTSRPSIRSRPRPQVRKPLPRDGFALTERLCVYPEYIDPEWISQPVLDVIKRSYWSFIPRRGSGRRARLTIADDVAPRAVAKRRDGATR